MREAFGELFDLSGDLLCITTNGMVNMRDENIMGGGCARGANKLFPGLARDIGQRIVAGGNQVYDLGIWRRFDTGTEQRLATFPTKRHWAENSTIDLIRKSAFALEILIEQGGYENVLLPRPGCGLGGLRWDDVRPVLETHLDDRVIIVAFEEEGPK